ncbi:HDIG domain-containing metalloprotein [uncultured Mitsuokella sp.]|uniref:HDIG domain-containing metalloprotein n=1 Tax=uncultured Mitsuokella sp. TaxID=453120 RepID=UPI00266F3CC8|nr:HDIG domain-containing metalloprotein [uncultured Mitsuokella sp.]
MSAAQRVRQFVRALTQHLDEDDRRFIYLHLPCRAVPLFYAMHPADQVHARNVAYTALDMARAQNFTREQKEFLMRCALLHDVGRTKGDLNVMGKVMAVLMRHYAPGLAKRWMQHRDPIGHALYVARHHAEIGAARLRAIGLYEEAAVIVHHHEPETKGDSEMLRLLRAADERN